jgi:beta-lactamase class A
MNGAVNDVAITWPTGRGPCLIAVYMSGSDAENTVLEAAHAQIGAWVSRTLRG